MKKLFTLSLGIALSASVFAQDFVYTPAQSRIDTVIAENFEAYDIYMTTPVAEGITYKWTRIQNTMPASWSYSLCDHGACYVGIPASGTMSPISLSQAQSGQQGFLKINLTVGQNYGSGIVKFYVYDANDINRGDTITFDIRWPAPNTVEEINYASLLTAYPNPTNDFITVKNSSANTLKVDVINVVGMKMDAFRLNEMQSLRYDMSALPKGIYFLLFEDKSGQKFTKKIIVK